jgi:hypothetical protein
VEYGRSRRSRARRQAGVRPMLESMVTVEGHNYPAPPVRRVTRNEGT